MPTPPRHPHRSHRSLRHLAACLALVTVGVLAPAAASQAEVDHVAWLNEHRSTVAVRGLAPATDLDAVALEQARAMADQDNLHHNADLAQDVTNWTRIGENVGVGPSLDRVLSALWASQVHRDNIVSDGFSEIGVAALEQDGRVWVVEVFREPTTPVAAPAPPVTAYPELRLSGDDRHATSVAVSLQQFTTEAEVVYLARADRLADAVSGGVLTRGPVLLVPACGAVPTSVSDEISRVNPQRVVALGGDAAICGSLLRAAGIGRQIGRLAGPDRFATSVAVSHEQFPDGAAVAYLARSDQFADAVAGGALTDGPVLLVPSCGDVPQVVAAEIDRLQADRVVALGGNTAVCNTVLNAAADGRKQGRLAGTDRYATAVAISEVAFPQGAAMVFLARGDAFADAVAGGGLTAGPVILVPNCGALPDSVANEIDRLDVDTVMALGGAEAVCDDVLTGAMTHRR